MNRAMLTKADLGHTEQLGSQMSQYANLFHIANLTGHELIFLKEEMTVGRGIALYDVFNLPNRVIKKRSIRFLPQYIRNGRLFENFQPLASEYFDERICNLSSSKNYNIIGFAGLYKHWEPSFEKIHNAFTFKPHIYQKALYNIERVKAESQPGAKLVSLHFRRKDYLASTVHVNLSRAYYEKALQFFDPARTKFIVFSDDIPWCRELDFLRTLAVCFSENANHVDLAMMSLCNHHIASNSSFAVWGSLLNRNPDKTVICPRNYISQTSKEYQWINGNYYPSAWIALDEI
jgi:hypothetical protein